MYNLKIVTPTEWTAYRNLMFQSLFLQLDKLHIQDRLWMVGVEEAGNPVGVAVLEMERDKGYAVIHCLFIVGVHRRKGLATKLLQEIRDYCKDQHIEYIKFAYYTGKSATQALEAWLHQQGWTEPKMEAVVFHIDSTITKAAWLRDRSLPKGLRLLPWNHIDQKERDLLAAGEEGVTYPDFLSPFKSFAPLETSNSLGLLSPSGIQGWSMTYRIAADTLLYDALFISPQYQQSGLALVMLTRSIRLQLETDIAYGLFVVNTSTPAMLKLAQHWIAPYVSRINEKRICYLKLN